MNKLRKRDKMVVILLLIASLVCLVVGFQSFHSARTYSCKAYEAIGEELDHEWELQNEVSEQIAYQKSHPEDTALSRVNFLSIILAEEACRLSQMKILVNQSASTTNFAKAAFLLAIVGWLGAVTGWLYAFRKTNVKKLTSANKSKG
ncbi:hypothetical protein ES706_01952 [subsurface metagenome]|nr:hypothetical protein [Dehalococcoidia bacterium]